MNTRLIHITDEAEKVILYCARVSSNNQESNDPKLLSYCARHGHWSIFEMASACFEIVTSRAIASQILRHRSFSFQEFSQRYAEITAFETYRARRQATRNRQSSIDDLPEFEIYWFNDAQRRIQEYAMHLYKEALSHGIAREMARFILPQSTQTRLYMHGTIRSWIHYLALRTKEDVQAEHREIALQIEDTLALYLPNIAKAVGWNNRLLNSLLTSHEKCDMLPER